MYSIAITFIMACIVAPQLTQADFADVTATSGVSEFKESWGAVSCDWNKDGYIDIILNNHRDPLSLYRNNGDGTFTDTTTLVNNPITSSDEHGIVCADFYPNDNYLEFAITTGGADNQLTMLRKFFKFDEQAGQYEDIAAQVKFQIKKNPGRSLLVTDYNGDNRLDIFESARKKASVAGSAAYQFDETNDSFMQLHGVLNDACENKVVLFSKYTDLDHDHIPEVTCIGQTLAHGAFEFQNGYFNEIWTQLSPSSSGAEKYNPVRDVAIADFNGDNKADIFVLGRDSWPANAYIEDGEVRARIITNNNAKGFHFFGGSQVVTLEFAAPRLNHRDGIFYGQNRQTDPSFSPPWVQQQTIILDPQDSRFWGQPTIGVQEGLYIWYDQVTQRWHTTLSSAQRLQLDTNYYASSDLTELALDFDPNSVARVPLLLNSDGSNGYSDVAAQSGFTTLLHGLAVETADFDNDGDSDLYIVLSNAPKDYPDEYYENDGTGVFTLKQTLPALPVGIGENLSIADYNQDGCLDMVVVNGYGEKPNNQGPVQIMRGLCPTANHWVQFDLDGTVANGLGATVEVMTGSATYSKLQDGGARLFGQNAQRLHFGLGENIIKVDVVVYWANGVITHYSNVAVDAVYSLAPDGSITPVGIRKPTIDRLNDVGLFIWQTSTNKWVTNVVSSDKQRTVKFDVISDQVVSNVVPLGIELNDRFTQSPNSLGMSLKVKAPWMDGIKFTITDQSNTCVSIANADVPIYLGPNRVQMPAAFDLSTLGGCDRSSVKTLGRPTLDSLSDEGVFIWENAQHRWQVEVVSADRSRVVDIDVGSNQNLTNVQQLNIDANDIFTILPNGLDLQLNASAPWMDGFKFTEMDNSNTCIKTTATDFPIYIGPNRIHMGSSVNLTTLTGC